METGQTGELESLRLKADEVLNESLESTRRISEMCQEARQTGTGVLVTLDGQGEQLDNIEAGVHKMGTDIKKAEQHLAKMKGNPIKRLFRRQAGRNRHGHDEESKSREKVAGVVVKRPLQALSVNNTSAFAVMGVDDEREKEIAANLKRVGEDISALLSMAKDIGLEVDVQNDQIKTIAGEGEEVDRRIRNADRKAADLIRKKV